MTFDHLIDDVIASRPRAREARPGDRPLRIEPKHDGHRVIIIRDHRGLRAYGRKLREDLWTEQLLAVPHLAEIIARIPPMTVVEGEIHSPNHRATSVRTLLNDRSPALQFSPFAMPVLRGEDWREASVHDVMPMLHRLLEVPVESQLIHEALLPLEKSTLTGWLHAARDEGLEGYMLKSEHWPTSRHGWLKLKHLSTVDCIVYKELRGVGKFYGKLGALMIALRDERGALIPIGKVGGGFKDEDRELPRGSWEGAVIEVQYQSVQANGRLQFPQFVRRRDDKPDAECTLDQLQE